MKSYDLHQSAIETELAQVRMRLANALEAYPDPIGYFDPDDRLILCNTAYARLHSGIGAPVSSGMTFEQILHQDVLNGALSLSYDESAKWIAERMAKHRQPIYETELRMRDGRWFRVIDRATDDGGRIHVLIDITKLKIAERRLSEVETGSKAGIWMLDLFSGRGHVNRYWAQMLGLDHETLGSVGFEEWRLLVHPEDVALAESGFLDCISGQTDTFEVEYRMRHAAGHWVWVMGRGGVSDLCPDGHVRQMAGVQLDISKRKKLEAELELRAAAVAATHDAILITDAEGRVIDANHAFVKLVSGECGDKLSGLHWQSFYRTDVASELATQAFPALKAGESWQGTVLARRMDGTEFEQEISLTSLSDGKAVWVSRDVSARLDLARETQALHQRLEITQRQEIVNLLAAGLTHDFSNLLMVISHLSDPSVSRQICPKEVLHKVHGISREISRLIAPIKAFGSDRSANTITDLGTVMHDATQILRLGAPPRISIEAHLPERPLSCVLDPLRLTQVLLNLGLNAKDAIGENQGVISFTLSEATGLPEGAVLQSGVIPAAPFALFKISDTGSGIPAAYVRRVWERHFTTKGANGTGLGLTLVAQILSSVGGGIALENRPEVGATFLCLLPLDESNFDETSGSGQGDAHHS
ncbi:PAS domain S-box-containing protein [Roseinatronobacter thiooxidans]|uniref:histidine kinase n=1 Tax=Roseinatronobacter thiooxidans TaxID=121821 RepID=A0A2W7QAN4_9RHOB|nr:PAS domain S-box protein [Roseinatronobacter thiooxidans]PZX45714.1 PAS domain S-box-containing protein [Roseinatronobacter thiooxidans]